MARPVINEINSLKKLALNYDASTRALAGAIIEIVMDENETKALYKSLNPTSRYTFEITKQTLPNKTKWNICNGPLKHRIML